MCNLDYLLVEFTHPGIPLQRTLKNLENFATKVMPRFTGTYRDRTAGRERSFPIEIVAPQTAGDFDPYDDGFGIMKDTQTAKPQAFRTGDAWFTYNVATNLARM